MAEQALSTLGLTFAETSTPLVSPERPQSTLFPGTITYYKMAAPCSSSPTGYIDWTNTTGDDTGRPACGGVLGDTFEVARWSE